VFRQNERPRCHISAGHKGPYYRPKNGLSTVTRKNRASPGSHEPPKHPQPPPTPHPQQTTTPPPGFFVWVLFFLFGGEQKKNTKKKQTKKKTKKKERRGLITPGPLMGTRGGRQGYGSGNKGLCATKDYAPPVARHGQITRKGRGEAACQKWLSTSSSSSIHGGKKGGELGNGKPRLSARSRQKETEAEENSASVTALESQNYLRRGCLSNWIEKAER